MPQVSAQLCSCYVAPSIVSNTSPQLQVLFTKGELAGRNFHYHFVVDRGMPYEASLPRIRSSNADMISSNKYLGMAASDAKLS